MDEPEPEDGALEPLPLPPMFGQLCVELELELELDPELVEPELELEPELPVLDVLGVVDDELVDEPVEAFDVVPDVVAALATSAPPATRPEASAPVASTVRIRIFMGSAFLGRVLHPLTRAVCPSVRPRPVGNRTVTWVSARSSATVR